jgi:FkbM family methyltransferase
MRKNKVILLIRQLCMMASLSGRASIFSRIMRNLLKQQRGKIEIADFDSDLTLELSLSEHMQSRIFWLGYYNWDIVTIMDSKLRPGMTVVDIGANIGEITLTAAKRVGPEGHVFAFEPSNEIATTLEFNIKRNNLGNVRVVRQALSDYSGEADLYESCGQNSDNSENFGLGSLYSADSNQKPVQKISVTTLDEFVEKNKIDRIDLIKIDIEGAELPCLKGAKNSISRFNPLLIIEIQAATSHAAGYRPEEILSLLKEMNYFSQKIGTNGKLSNFDLKIISNYQNVLCTPMHEKH